MVCDPGFRAEVGAAMDVVSQDVSIEPAGDVTRVRIDMTQRTQGLPPVARKVVGDLTRVVQTETWEADGAADLEVQIPGRPGHIRGRITLRSDGPRGTLESFEARRASGCPWSPVGSRGSSRDPPAGHEQAVGARWLAGDRS